jgi:hypothetical protein
MADARRGDVSAQEPLRLEHGDMTAAASQGEKVDHVVDEALVAALFGAVLP